MTPAQTHDHTMNYLYSQCEDIACRSIAPMMDTPAVKFIYSAKIRAPKEYNVFMSAVKTTTEAFNSTWTESIFFSPVKIQSYLIAIAVGDLEKQPIPSNVTKTPIGVITEPGFMAKVQKEFDGLPNWFHTVEGIFPSTPYPWPQYDILVLPPSFPMGGMENPMLTFVSPTVIVGDKSQVYVAAHEMAHSWTGNSVTCANWANFWLNEGFTVFAERKAGELTNGLDFAKVASYIGNQTAYEAMETYGYWDSYSSLHPNVGSDLPDNSFSVIPYEKGFQFLYYMQSLMGDRLFGKLLDEYIAENKGTSVTWPVFQEKAESFMFKSFPVSEARWMKKTINWNQWIYGPGLAPIK
jgi:leukotriene-A4 hydrolase